MNPSRPFIMVVSGPPSTGKSTTTRVLRDILEEPVLLFEADESFPEHSDRPHTTVEAPIVTFHRSVAVWATEGHNLIVDGALPADPALITQCLSILDQCCACLLLVDFRASVDLIREREASRPGTRIPGYAKSLVDFNSRNLPYISASVDTTMATPENAARRLALDLRLPMRAAPTGINE